MNDATPDMPEPEHQPYSVGAVLSVLAGRLLCPIREVYAVLDGVTGVPHMTHQLGRAAEEVRPHVAAACPGLAAVEVPELSSADSVAAFVASLAPEFGTQQEVPPMPPGEYVPRDPIAELREMTGSDNVIVAVVP